MREERREKYFVKWKKMNNISVFIGMCDDYGHYCQKWMDKWVGPLTHILVQVSKKVNPNAVGLFGPSLFGPYKNLIRPG